MKKTSRIALVLAVLVLATSCFVGNTFAKYTTTVTGTDTVTVAKWAFKQGDTAITMSAITFDLFNTIKDTDGTVEDNVKAGQIAPGTSGSFAIVLENESEVTANYLLTYNGTNENSIPLKFSLDSTDWENSISDLNMTEAATMVIGADATTVTVYWKWDFAGDDSGDTALGTAGTAVYTVNVECVFTQVD